MKTQDGRKNPQAFLTIFSVNQPVNPGNPRTQGTITTPLEWEQKASPDKRSGNGPKPKVRACPKMARLWIRRSVKGFQRPFTAIDHKEAS